MSQTYNDFIRACNELCTQWVKLDAPTDWEGVKILEAHGTTWMRISRFASSEEVYVHPTNEQPVCDEDVDDEADPEALVRPTHRSQPQISYDIVHSPSYQVPVLYVALRDSRLPSLEEIYKLVVPKPFQGQIKFVGIMGALSMTEHPILGRPAYFVHPCQTAEAMRSLMCGRTMSPEEYLLLWFGLVGSGVRLNVPVELGKSMLRGIEHHEQFQKKTAAKT